MAPGVVLDTVLDASLDARPKLLKQSRLGSMGAVKVTKTGNVNPPLARFNACQQ